MKSKYYSDEFVKELEEMHNDGRISRRAWEACSAILSRGSVTTLELRDQFGLQHPPRAIRDLKDAGVEVNSARVKVEGKSIAQYRLVEKSISKQTSIRQRRKAIPKQVKEDLIQKHGGRCTICGGTFPNNELQVDHRVPFEIGGDPEKWTDESIMLLCKSDNRSKSWACEHCANWKIRDVKTCQNCYWSHPDGQYTHVTMKPERRLAITWSDAEVQQYEKAADEASELEESLQQFIKDSLDRSTKRKMNE